MSKHIIGLILIFVAASSPPTEAQDFSGAASVGIEYYDAPSLSQYFSATTGNQTPGTYTTSVQLEAAVEYFVATDWALGIEYAYLTNQSNGNGLQIGYSYSLPTITVRRVVTGDNYYLRFGGGIGYHFSSLGQDVLAYGSTTNYSSSGLGLKFDAALDSKLGENLYARVDADARAEFTGILKTKDGTPLRIAVTSAEVNSDFSGVGIALGLVYYF
ncbi:MAG TPA: hypothetical protein VLX91_16990 [Candidatus Acidoferrales bacterium]|nr:hypothetical protein [Candidatus Acidoferrales bacterium]